MKIVRVDSCRKCGQELQIMRLCPKCQQPLHFDCSNCNAFIDDPIHQHEIIPRQVGIDSKIGADTSVC